MKQLIYTLLILCFSAVGLIAQSPVKWTWEAKHLEGNDFEITFKAKINNGWYTYSQFLKEGGPIATSIELESTNQEKIGKASESTSKPAYKVSGFDKMFDMEITKYKKDLTLQQKIRVKDLNKSISGYMTYMTCDNTQCRPPTDVEFSFKPADLIKKTVSTEKPTETPQKKKDNAKQDQSNVVPDAPKSTVAPVEETNSTIEEHSTIDNSTATVENPVSWDISFSQVSETEIDLIAKATITDGWYVYSQKLEKDDGPLPTVVVFKDGLAIEVVSSEEKASNPAYKIVGYDEMFDMNITKYKHDFTIIQRLKTEKAGQEISGFIEFMTCDATQCRPPTAIDFKYNEGKPAVINTINGNQFNPVRTTLKATNKKPYGSCDGVTGNEINNDSEVASMNWLAIFLAGFGGGLLALLTPCVFPMIPMTVALFSKGKGKEKKNGVKNALLFGASIIVIYVSLGLVVTSIFGASALNELSTHWLMNLTFFLLFTVFAISFFGYFDISLPSSWANKADAASSKEGLLGIFFGAFAISLVSFSCTGPIVGTLLVQAAINGGLGGPAIGMLGFSIALALPFTLFAIFPSWLQSLPRSGGWMTTMKVILGFLELALGLKFLSTADLTQHWGILPYELFIGLWAVIFIAMALYLLGFIYFPHDNKSAKIGVPRKIFGGLVAVFSIYILAGFMTNPKTNTFATPSLLSGLAPSACYSYIKPCLSEVVGGEEGFSDHCPPGIKQCFDDYDKALAYANKVNKPLLIDFTGFGCVNCRKMEENVWTQDKIATLINEDYVLVSLYVDDREKLAQTLVAPDGRKIRNIGNKWALFQEVNFDKQSQPYYVLVNGKEQVLNTPTAYTPNVDVYEAFLQCGISQYNKSMQK